MSKTRSGTHKESRKERLAKMPAEMQVRLGEFELGLPGVREWHSISDTSLNIKSSLVPVFMLLLGYPRECMSINGFA
jgi:hypothetical protein